MPHMISRRDTFSALCAVGLGGLLSGRVCSAEILSGWPSWRGPTRDGRIGTSEAAELSWPSDLKSLSQLWSVALADSYSGPIVTDSTVYVTETVEKRDETLLALDRSTGAQLWKRSWPGAMSVPFFAKSNGDWIRSTPATDGARLVVGGMRDVLACFDVSSGQELWRIDFVQQHGATLPAFGLVCSPLIDGDHVYVQAGGAVRKINLQSGELVWENLRDEGGMYGGAFSSPVIDTIHGIRQLIVQTRQSLAGLDLEQGRVLWQRDVAAFRGMNILTPVVWDNKVFTSSYGGRAQLFEFRLAEPSWEVKTVWEAKAEAYMSSPIVAGDHLYLHLRNNRLSCIDLSSGQEKWRTTPFGKYWSMVSNGREILALDQVGELILFAANPDEFQLLDRRQISDEPCWAHLALAGDQLFIRRQRGLDAYRWDQG